ncbi:MAG: phosphoribosylglycinamide formyltransferase [Melioribacteraceae bacterium]|nr:phosphoribosylglycinamide formyltransferase [Melioribacteraceae bacterium]
MLKIAVFVSGRGSNLKSLINKIDSQKARVLAVVSNKSDCLAISYSKGLGISTFIVGDKHFPDSLSSNEITETLISKEIDLIVLAGYLKMLPESMVESFENKIINIHPALLPSFGGKGMYGMNVHKAVFDSSAMISGATVHFVNKNYDEGKIIAQRVVDITNVKSPEEIASRVLEIEHELLPYVVSCFADKRIFINNNRVEIGTLNGE